MPRFESKDEMWAAIREDNKYFDTHNRKFLYRTNDHLVCIRKYMFYLRHEQYYIRGCSLYQRMLRLYYARKKNNIGNKIGLYIGCDCLEPGITIFHHGSIIINGYARVGKGTCFHGNNCIGNDGKSLKAPRIGKNVDIGFGATIIGDIEIADDCKIGAGAVVVKSCYTKGATLVGVPARELK